MCYNVLVRNKVLFLLALIFVTDASGAEYGAITRAAKSFLTPQQFPTVFNDASFATRMQVLAEGYDDFDTEYDENGRCISGCAYKGITIETERQMQERARQELQALVETEELQQQPQQQQQSQQSLSVVTTPVSPGMFGPPVGGAVKVSSDFGERRPPKTQGNKQGSRYHKGVDIKALTGTSLYAAADGRVVEARYSSSYGNVVKIEHNFSESAKKAMTVYAHMNTLDVKKGDVVKKGQKIGTAGNTGNSGAAHLHYELRFDGVHVDPLGATVKPVMSNNRAAGNAHVTRGKNYLGGSYCFKRGISSTRLAPYVGNDSGLRENFPDCTGWCTSY